MAVNIKALDLEILWTGPQDDTDARVPTAEELAASSHLAQQNLLKAAAIERPAGLRDRPAFTCTNKSVILPAGMTPYAPGHPALAPLAGAVTCNLPALADTVSSISRYDYVYLMAFAVEVTSAIDGDIALPFEWRAQNGTIQTLTKENTRRLRTVWAVVISQGVTDAATVYAALTTAGDTKTLTISKSANGTALNGTIQIYPLDANLIDTKTYVVRQDTIALIDLLRVWRVQNFNQAGYVWGRTGEANFEADYHLQPTYRYVGEGWDDWRSRKRQTLRRLFLGLPMIGSPAYDRAVQNLLNGQVGSNLDAPGLATASPNGSTALANRQRVTFTNQAVTQRTYCLPVVTVDASGFAQATVPFQVNSPSGAYFSQSLTDHKIWSATGRDITADGTLTGLGGTGALVWTANSAVVAPGDLVYCQAAIYYPAGSGFAVTGTIEKVFLDAAQINAGNVREGGNDIDAYTAPANSENFIVVLGKERAALHYVYKRVTVTSTSGGVVAIPNTERGAIAFISGAGAPAGRIDKPVISGLSNSTSYTLLVYYPPQATESWQFQFKTSRYAGTTEESWLAGARIVSDPIAIAHTQGGGNSIFLADGELQYEAIAFRLPANTLSGAVKHYLANYKIQFVGESDFGFSSFREVAVMAAAALVLPRNGLVLATVNASSAQSKGVSCKLTNVAGQTLGVAKLPIQCQQVYQLLVAFVAEKAGDRRLVVVTLNEGNTSAISSCAFDTDSPAYAGIDTFTLF